MSFSGRIPASTQDGGTAQDVGKVQSLPPGPELPLTFQPPSAASSGLMWTRFATGFAYGLRAFSRSGVRSITNGVSTAAIDSSSLLVLSTARARTGVRR